MAPITRTRLNADKPCVVSLKHLDKESSDRTEHVTIWEQEYFFF